jgi:hypothetical protein
MELTDEQSRVVASKAHRLVVEAGAGAAKTTTLSAYAQARPSESLLYIAFNRAIAEEAKTRMPANVKAQTMHSMAWRKARELFGDGAMDKVGNTYPSTVARCLACSPLVATGALGAVQTWCGSADDELDEGHLPVEIVERTQDPEAMMRAARALWRRMLDPSDRAVLLPHDAYLKLYQLDRPQLRYTRVLCDEAQDLSPSTFELLRDQRAAVVLVGDSAQAIYGFRGTTDALRRLQADERLPLSRSFRFGEGVAAMANALLFAYKPGHRLKLVGGGQPRQTALRFDLAESHAIIARTNASLFDAAVQALHMNRPYHFIGGVQGYKFDRLLDCYHLWAADTKAIRDPYVRSFRTFAEMEEMAEAADDKELKRLVRVVLDYQRDVPTLVERICAKHVALATGECAKSFNGLTFCTAHKSKGLEFERIWLADDYLRLMERGQELPVEDVDPQEINVLYVALTRARAAVRLNEAFEEWLRYRGVVR